MMAEAPADPTVTRRTFQCGGGKTEDGDPLITKSDDSGFCRHQILKWCDKKKVDYPRYVVTSLTGSLQRLYDKMYCARGEMENRIKEQRLYLFADRTSCMNWLPNQFRMLLSGIAYTLLQTIRRLGLCGTELAHARCDTIRLKLLKIGAAVVENTRRIRFLLSSAYPWQRLFRQVVANLKAG